jgi:hypothetical protein
MIRPANHACQRKRDPLGCDSAITARMGFVVRELYSMVIRRRAINRDVATGRDRNELRRKGVRGWGR